MNVTQAELDQPPAALLATQVSAWEALACSAIAALIDLEAGFAWRELHVDVASLRAGAEALGASFDDQTLVLAPEGAG